MSIVIHVIDGDEFSAKKSFSFLDIHGDLTDNTEQPLIPVILPEQPSETMGYIRVSGQQRTISFSFTLKTTGTDLALGTAALAGDVNLPNGNVKTALEQKYWLRHHIFQPGMGFKWYIYEEDLFPTPSIEVADRVEDEPDGFRIVVRRCNFRHKPTKPNIIEGVIEIMTGYNITN